MFHHPTLQKSQVGDFYTEMVHSLLLLPFEIPLPPLHCTDLDKQTPSLPVAVHTLYICLFFLIVLLNRMDSLYLVRSPTKCSAKSKNQ